MCVCVHVNYMYYYVIVFYCSLLCYTILLYSMVMHSIFSMCYIILYYFILCNIEFCYIILYYNKLLCIYLYMCVFALVCPES